MKAVRRFDRVDGDDLGMSERGGGLRLTAKTLERGGAFGQPRRNQFQRHVPLQLRVMRGVHFAHSARAQQRGDAVMPERGPDRERLKCTTCDSW